MAQQVVLAKIEFPSLSALVDNAGIDIVIEQQGTSTDLVYSTVFTKLTTFINTASGGATHPLSYYISTVFNRGTNASSITLYDITAHLNGSPHGSPVAIQNFTLGPAASTLGSPEGLCWLVNFRGAYGTDVEFAPGARPRARDRGRVYLGPAVGNMFGTESGTGRCIWTAASVDDVGKAFLNLNTSGGTTDVPTWVQWSRANAKVNNIITCSIEDAPRYQRRRVDSGSSILIF